MEERSNLFRVSGHRFYIQAGSKNMIDWTNPACQVTPHFTVKDCLWLPHWNRLANYEDGFDEEMQDVILATCQKNEQIRTLLGVPMTMTSMFRPQKYSPLVGGTEHDVHTKGVASDFTTVPQMSIEDAKSLLRPNLAALGIRMEAGTTDWIHIDTWQVGPSGREFTA